MVQFKSFESGIQVNGPTIQSVINGMGAFTKMAVQLLQQGGIVEYDPSPGNWYDQQDWLNAFRLISDKVGPKTLFQIGKQIPETAEFPPEIDNIEKALASIDIAYHMNHRNASGDVLFNPARDPPMLNGIGHYRFQPAGERSAIICGENPYPCEFDRGIVTAMAKRFNNSSKVVHAEGDCRASGAETCEYHIQW